jgi:hypothetical protein
MRAAHEVQIVRWLIEVGLNNCQISRATGVARQTIREWRHRPLDWPERRVIRRPEWESAPCPRCDDRELEEGVYAYLLGLYLGDGTISKQAKGSSYRLRIVCANAYPRLISLCKEAMKRVKGIERDPGVIQREGCVEVNMGWAHWPCLFPQHGPGRKHERRIELAEWQGQIISRHPEHLIRGLIHSDGYRGPNWVNGKAYWRYQFTNNSDDIRGIFCEALEMRGIRWRRMNWNTISVARRLDVQMLDSFVGPKS